MKHLGSAAQRAHRLLILDGAAQDQRFRYQSFASDLAGNDIRSHEGKAAGAIGAVRDFLAPLTAKPIAGPRAIHDALTRFESTLPMMATAAEQSLDELTFTDRLRHIGAFIGRVYA